SHQGHGLALCEETGAVSRGREAPHRLHLQTNLQVDALGCVGLQRTTQQDLRFSTLWWPTAAGRPRSGSPSPKGAAQNRSVRLAGIFVESWPFLPPRRSAKMPINLKTVVFVCTGNFYRSRFSEYLFNALAKNNGLYWRATSRGLRTWKVGVHEGPISEFAAYRLTALDVPFDRARFPIQLSELDLEDADLVIALKK